jgi:hypothetical protein
MYKASESKGFSGAYLPKDVDSPDDESMAGLVLNVDLHLGLSKFPSTTRA